MQTFISKILEITDSVFVSRSEYQWDTYFPQRVATR